MVFIQKFLKIHLIANYNLSQQQKKEKKILRKVFLVGAYDAQSLKYTNPRVANNFYNYLTEQDVIYEDIL